MNQPVDPEVEVAIIGAGPIGLEMAAALKMQGVRYLHFEAKQIGYTFTWWPKNTPFFSTTERIEIAGVPIQKTNQERTTGEEYLAYLRSVVELYDLQVHTYEPVIDIRRDDNGFVLLTRKLNGVEMRYRCRKIILGNGDMDRPNLLGIPGEDLPHVTHYFTDPHLYFRSRLLIVGGKNSAVEAALRCWRAGSLVSISYRKSDFNSQSVKHWLLPDIKTQIENGRIGFYPSTRPIAITPQQVILEDVTSQRQFPVETDFVYLATGFTADSTLFEKAGVELIGPQRMPTVLNPDTMETNVPGIYVAGTSAAGTQSSYRLFIENTHVHVGKIIQAITGKWPERLGTVQARQYDLPLEQIKAN